MIVPKFDISQNENAVILNVYVPYAKISDIEVSVIEDTVIFSTHPYFLRIRFPGQFCDDECKNNAVEYDAGRRSFVVTCMKKNKHEEFSKLELLSELLNPKGTTTVQKNLIEIISSETTSIDCDTIGTPETEISNEKLNSAFGYGFANSYKNVIGPLRQDISSAIEICLPDQKSAAERKQERIEHELNAFDDDHYLYDLFECNEVRKVLKYNVYWNSSTPDEFTQSQKDFLTRISKKELLVEESIKKSVFYGLVDILYAYCYNERINEWEECCEAYWNIVKLSATLSWLETFTDLKETLICCVKRTLMYPLYRHFDLSLKVIKDVVELFALGSKHVLQHLLKVRGYLLANDTNCYIFNELYVDDYCRWVQTVDNQMLLDLSDDIKKIQISKYDLDMEIVELEFAGTLVIEEESENLKNISSSSTSDSERDLQDSDTSGELDSDDDSNPDETILKDIENLKL